MGVPNTDSDFARQRQAPSAQDKRGKNFSRQHVQPCNAIIGSRICRPSLSCLSPRGPTPLPLRTSLPYGLKRAVSSGMAEINNLTTYVNGAETTGTSHTPMPSRPRARTQGRRLAARAPIADGRLHRHPAPRPLSTRLEQPLADTRRVHGGMVAQLCQNRRDRNARRQAPAPRGEEASCSGSDC